MKIGPKILLSILAGFLSGFCLPDRFYDPFDPFKQSLVFFCLVPLFVTLYTEKSPLATAAYSFLAGLIHNLKGWYFLLGIHPLSWMGLNDQVSLLASWAGWMVASTEQALFWGIAGVSFVTLNRLLPERFFWSMPLFGAILWVVLVEIFPENFSLQIPWNSIHLALASNPFLSLSAKITNAHILSFWLISTHIFVAIFVSDFFSSRFQFKKYFSSLIVQLVLSSLLIGFCTYQILFSSSSDSASLAFRALLVQENLTTAETRINRPSAGRFYQSIANVLRKEPADLVILPEGTLPQDQLHLLASCLRAEYGAIAILAGSYEHTPRQIFNSATLIDKNGEMQNYRKRILVPFGEFIPSAALWEKVLAVLKLERLMHGNFAAGKEHDLLSIQGQEIAPLICFEIAFPELVFAQIHQNSSADIRALVLLGDISWFHEKRMQVAAQMMAQARFRAIESSRPLLVSINAGPLAFIDSRGKLYELETNATALSLP
ncbi:MAG: apolipoprotein N-acyltransferase [Candidatus Caenarcaniphilales bacterium]|nr:apolipoprotein N-acyltransferase [Candidatus Caenarcaniphilales bacterium]